METFCKFTETKNVEKIASVSLQKQKNSKWKRSVSLQKQKM